ncbi:MAG: DNA polymerase IV [Firmicutes bacterium]|jgi:nucleotidyltransferase/DNA polymerase involved in DNA repair|nr:DNA polymerase IV [Bacillota bacterium]
MKERKILLVDMESFYASVEIAANPSLRGKPVAVCGDPEQRRGIILAANKEAKAWGIRTGMWAGEGRSLCPNIIYVKPHMKLYIDISLAITDILSQFTDRLFPYSIDEQFLDITGCEKLFGDPHTMAFSIIEAIRKETGINSRIGIGSNLLQAKMACDRFAKKNEEGVFELSARNYSRLVWPLPISDLFGVGKRMNYNLQRMGIRNIGHLALLSRETLRRRWGANGEILWLNAHGIDYSKILTTVAGEQKGVSHSMTLPRDYRKIEEIETVLLELAEETCYRARAIHKAARVVHLYCQGADFDAPSGFSRQRTLPEPSARTMDIYSPLLKLFKTYWDGRAIRRLGVSLSQLVDVDRIQLSFLGNREKERKLGKAMDEIRQRYGPTAIFRLSSLASGGCFLESSTRIGGHER